MSIRIRDVLIDFKKNKILLCMLLPSILYFFIFSYIPMAGIIIAFKNLDYAAGIFRSPWTGFNNFRFFFISGSAFTVTVNTVLYNISFIIVNTFLQITIAIFLSELANRYFKKVAQTFLLFPYFISWVIVSAFVYNIFNYEYGVLNNSLKMLQIEPVDILGKVWIWKYLLVALNAWKEAGYGSIIYLAAIMSIDREMYEAAEIEGANVFQQIFKLTIPSLRYTMVILILLAVGQIFRGNFQMFYQLTGNNGLLYKATDVIDTFTFRALVNSQDFGMAAAVGLYQSLLCFGILLVTNYIIRKVNDELSLF